MLAGKTLEGGGGAAGSAAGRARLEVPGQVLGGASSDRVVAVGGAGVAGMSAGGRCVQVGMPGLWCRPLWTRWPQVQGRRWALPAVFGAWCWAAMMTGGAGGHCWAGPCMGGRGSLGPGRQGLA